MKHLLIERWARFSRKDQLILIVLSIIIACFMLYTLCWIPVQSGLEKLSHIIPEKQSQLTLMKQQSIEIETKRNRVELIKTSQNGLKGVIEESARAHKINLTVKPSSLHQQAIDIAITHISFNIWMEWLRTLRAEHGISLDACHIEKTPQNNAVSITGTFVVVL